MNPPSLSDKACSILEERYLKRDDLGRVIETPEGMFRRVAHAVAQADLEFSGTAAAEETEEKFFGLMTSLDMLPNSPTLMNAGRGLGQLSACFVLPIEDSMDSIFESLKQMALIHKSGGGTGFSFSGLRPRNDQVGSTKGISSGPVSFMRVFDAATNAVKQGGMRRGANMAVLVVDHPDIMEFAVCKRDGTELNNFNLSVAVTDSFMKALERNESYELINPRNRAPTESIRALDVFNAIVQSAWQNGEPGVLFIDRINRDNPFPHMGRIECTNPCGEAPLLPYECCSLASLNLARVVRAGKIDWPRLATGIQTSVHFLDNVIEVNSYLLPEIEAVTRANRKIGLGVMGFADLLIQLGIPYGSTEALGVAESLMRFIAEQAQEASERLARDRGPFPNFAQSTLPGKGLPPQRNATTTTIAPTGTISLIAGCSSGIEPLFAVVFRHNVLGREGGVQIHSLFEEIARREGFYSEDLLDKILRSGSVSGLPGVPEKWQRLFATALDITPEIHVRMQAAFQRYTENAISKTVNMPASATKEDVRNVFHLAHELGCKGITVYRDGSRGRQVLETGKGDPLPTGNEVNPSTIPTNPGPKARPRVLNGTTRRIETGCGSLYVTINSEESGSPFEIFTSMGKAGGCASSQAEAIGRLGSLALRSGVQPKQIVRQLRGISCHMPRGFGDHKVSSCADAVAQALLCLSTGEGEIGEIKDRSPVDGARSLVKGMTISPISIEAPARIARDQWLMRMAVRSAKPADTRIVSDESYTRQMQLQAPCGDRFEVPEEPVSEDSQTGTPPAPAFPTSIDPFARNPRHPLCGPGLI